MIPLVRSLLADSADEIPEVAPTPESLALVTRQYRTLRPACGLGLWRVARFTASGVEHIPRTGPVVIITNHVALYDALHINYVARRPVIFLTSSALFNGSLRARFLQSMGMIPKRKFTPDARAIRLMRAWVESGAAVGVFPEGERSWDGQPLPMVPGIGKLIRFLGAPVVTGRIHNGDRHWPRWAVNRRWGRVHAEFDAPVTFGRRDDPDAIAAHILSRITLSPEQVQRWPVRGRALAAGLSNLLFRCPACEAPEALREAQHQIHCTACGAAWRIDTAGLLHAVGGPAHDTALTAEVPRLQRAVAEGWTPTDHQDTLLESQPGRLLDRSGPQAVTLGQGRLHLSRSGLRFHDGQHTLLDLPFSQIRAVTIEESRRLWLMTADRIYEPDLPLDSIVKWGWIAERWRRAASPETGA